MFSLKRWNGKVAVITGASAGIGAAIAEKLVNEGLVVVGLARRSERIEELAKKLAQKPGKLHAIKADCSKEEDIVKAFAYVEKNIGPIHILINNAGIIQQTNLTEGDTEKWRKLFDINVLGLCIATREAVRNMKANKTDGHIIHINSVYGHTVGQTGRNVYPASKYAVTALTETLRQELNQLGLKIKITSISPGSVITELAETSNIVLPPSAVEARKNLPRLQAEDLADSVLYVLSTPPHVQVHELMIRPLGEVI